MFSYVSKSSWIDRFVVLILCPLFNKMFIFALAIFYAQKQTTIKKKKINKLLVINFFTNWEKVILFKTFLESFSSQICTFLLSISYRKYCHLLFLPLRSFNASSSSSKHLHIRKIGFRLFILVFTHNNNVLCNVFLHWTFIFLTNFLFRPCSCYIWVSYNRV